VTKGPVDIQAPISSSTAIPLHTKTLGPDPDITAEDSLDFHDSDQGVDILHGQEIHDVLEEEMPEKTDIMKVVGNAPEGVASHPDTAAFPQGVVPVLAEEEAIQVIAAEVVPLPILARATKPASAIEKVGQKAGAQVGAVASSKRLGDRKSKNPSMDMSGSNPYSVGGALEGLIEAGTIRSEAAPNVPDQAQIKKKKVPVSPMKVNPRQGVGKGGANEVIYLQEVQSEIATNKVRSQKLVIFNIHETLLDSSLKVEKNSNAAIRASVQTEIRRVVFRPGLIQFLSQCFMNFSVAFWGSKSKSYMDEVLLAVLKRLKGPGRMNPYLFDQGNSVRLQASKMEQRFRGTNH
jgi:hypothetical protein